MDKLQEIAKNIVDNFELADKAREKALPLHRQAIRGCSLAIRAIHRHEIETAQEQLQKVDKLLEQINGILTPYPSIWYAGFFQDAQKEFVEANLTLALVMDTPLPTPEELHVDGAVYLNGLAEAVGELQRHAHDFMRHDQIEESEKLLNKMEEALFILTSIDFPDALTRGLRRSTDIARGCTEKTRANLTAHYTTKQLRQDLQEFKAKLAQG